MRVVRRHAGPCRLGAPPSHTAWLACDQRVRLYLALLHIRHAEQQCLAGRAAGPWSQLLPDRTIGAAMTNRAS